MNIRALIYSAVALVSAGALRAQHPAASGGRIAGIAPAPAPAPVSPPSNFGPYGPVFYGNIPVLVFGDGRVFADFGRGWEQVVRSCALPVNYGSAAPVQPTVTQPSVSQPAIPASTTTLPYTQPVPNQPTPSQQMAVSNTQTVQSSQQVATNTHSCWAVGATGRVFIGLP